MPARRQAWAKVPGPRGFVLPTQDQDDQGLKHALVQTAMVSANRLWKSGGGDRASSGLNGVAAGKFGGYIDRPGKLEYTPASRCSHAPTTCEGHGRMEQIGDRKEMWMPHEANETPKQNQNRFLRKLEGEEVLIVFLDGKAVQGVLIGYDTYTLFLKREDGLEVAVFKHAVKYMHAASKKTKG